MASTNELLLILCVGNPARGDDAAGPLIANALQREVPHLAVIETFQLQPELVEDFVNRETILIIDAETNSDSPLSLRRIIPAPTLGWCSHALSPEQLAGLYETAFRQSAPEVIAIGVQAHSFELGAPPSEDLLMRVDAVVDIISSVGRVLLTSPPPKDIWSLLAEAFSESAPHA